METRKIQLTGGSTFTVSLPKRWAKEHGLESGARMHLYPHSDGSLLVRPDPTNNGDREITLTVDHRSETDIVQTVRAGYVSGFDKIALVATGGIDDTQRRAVTRTVDGLIGLEVVSETKRRIVLQSLLNTRDVSIRQTVIQLQRVTLSMHENAVTAAIDEDSELVTRVRNRDDEADRLFGMVSRHYQQSLSDLQAIDQLDIDRSSIADYYTTAQQLERVADHAEKMAVIAECLDASATETIQNFDSIARSARGIVTDASSVLLAGADVEMAYRALDDRDALLTELDRSDKQLYHSDSSDQHPVGLLLDSVRRTSEYGGNIAEAMIQRAVRTGTLSE
ncbi:phosphate signaling complex PhoU family protein [Halocatena pleomorpha]|uniref:Phosphate uptake regulator PhoU n=1 Tax=Halocatena pleomorpha TaxID=1785090 RepID=A0A3P3RAE6_9EURY|nr:phosphate uptake regulator PhoU [Halocatena pleomorpha]RRJ30462.1 phosphate uptake regulator PhoU [Halocatena pleomorpha]